MFVPPASHASHLYPQFPAKPRPLQPVFTFAQSQSCMNLGMHLADPTVDPIATVPRREGWSETCENWLASLAPAKPPPTYKSPLQKVGEALRAPQTGSAATSPGLDAGSAAPKLQSGEQDPVCYFPNYSYKLLSGSPTRSHPPFHDAFGSAQGYNGSGDIGTVSSPDTRAQLHAQTHNGYLAGGTGLLSSLFSNPRTRAPFKPQKAGRGTSSWQLKQYAEATLGSGSLRKAVKLPEGEDKDEWLAVNVVDFYNQINLLYGSITEFCSPQSCPEMKATDEFEYLWQDSENYKKPTKMAAPQYIEHLMAWVQSNVDNEQMFPSRIGVPFPKAFPSLIRNMFKRLYRVYAHIYCHHYPVIIELGLEPHLNTSFKHYVLFIDEHGLANGSKDFWGPLGDLVESMLRSD
ncbi:hypothetical protein P280DRAFT_474174 [Massarina eburnea CBS 473.64]|uniref:Mob1/phocein n=1 Tax=Massarina eburnea CBS 473.64 TaxID=1395130 RepID=A0A6A6RJ45_9PLEO|nr:hypothetical protein P280DRAFT_474174 [Massarina eburnea CBS 473.64]